MKVKLSKLRQHLKKQKGDTTYKVSRKYSTNEFFEEINTGSFKALSKRKSLFGIAFRHRDLIALGNYLMRSEIEQADKSLLRPQYFYNKIKSLLENGTLIKQKRGSIIYYCFKEFADVLNKVEDLCLDK